MKKNSNALCRSAAFGIFLFSTSVAGMASSAATATTNAATQMLPPTQTSGAGCSSANAALAFTSSPASGASAINCTGATIDASGDITGATGAFTNGLSVTGGLGDTGGVITNNYVDSSQVAKVGSTSYYYGVNVTTNGRFMSGNTAGTGGLWVDGGSATQFFGSVDATHLGIWNKGTLGVGGTALGGSDARNWRLVVDNAGNVGIGSQSPSFPLDVNGIVRAVDFYHNSDARLKTDIHPIDNALDKILAIRGVEFTWKKDGRADMGVVAQDVAKTFPNVVSKGSDSDGMMAVDYDSLVGPMIEAIRTLNAKDDRLEVENKILRGELTEIQTSLKTLKQDNERLRAISAGDGDRLLKPSTTTAP